MGELSWHILHGDNSRPYSYPSMGPEERRVAMLLDALQDMQPYEGGCSGIVDDRTRSAVRKIRNAIDRRQQSDANIPRPKTKC